MTAESRSPTSPSPGSFQVQSVADQVYAVLRERIAAGEVARGGRLHQEDLADEFGVSRTPVREALRRLATEGLVELRANRGARVTLADSDALRLAYETRLIVEPGAARAAAERRLPSPLKAMRAAITRETRAGRSAERLFAANRDFHLALIAGADNEQLTQFMEQVWLGQIGSHLYAEHQDIETLQDDHRAHESIADAIAAGEPDLSEVLARGHLTRSRALLFGG